MENQGEVEITHDLVIEEPQRRLLDVHSVVNILTIVVHEIQVVGTLVGDDVAADLLADLVVEWGTRMTGGEETVIQLGRVPELRERLIGWVIAQRKRVSEPQLARFDCRLDNLESVFNILEVRAAELIERAGETNHYRAFSLEHLRANLHAAFMAIEKNSLGRYRIAFSAGARAPGDYLMEFDLKSPDGLMIRMPAVFGDVVRDLACNARKYTDPGGSIRVTLQEEDDGGLFLQVKDNGRGIPEGEIKDVVSFGYRASSEGNRAQTGGGFGLTKAYFVAKRFGGRMWIRSSPGAGTRVTMRLPQPLSLSPGVREGETAFRECAGHGR